MKKLARTMKAGDYVQLETVFPGNDRGKFFQSYTKAGSTLPDSHLNYADSGAWNPKDRCFYFFGSGHLAYPAFIRYCEATNEWTHLPVPPWIEELPDDVSMWSYTSHAYDSNTIDVTNQIFYTKRRQSSELFAFDLSSYEWSRVSYSAMSATAEDALTMFNGVGLLFLTSKDDRVNFLPLVNGERNLSTDNGSIKKSALPVFNYHNTAEYSPILDAALVGGGNGSSQLYWVSRQSLTSSEFTSPTAIAPAPENILTTNYGSGGWLVFDPVDGRFVIQAVQGSIYKFDHTANDWSRIGTSPLPKNGEYGIGHTAAAVIPDYQVIMFVNAQTGVWFYKPSGSACAGM
jgi:hypothetical protein